MLLGKTNDRKHGPAAGFTMVEILTVLAIIVLFMGITLPVAVTMVSGKGLSGAAQTTASAIQMARSTAISKRCFVTLVFEQVKGETGATDHYRIRITGHGSAKYYDLPPSVIVGDEAVEVKLADQEPGRPAHFYPLIFSPDGSLATWGQPGASPVERIIILRDAASEPFTDVAKSYFGNAEKFKNNVYDAYGSEPDKFLETAGDPERRKLIDPNMNGIPDYQQYVMVDRNTGRTFISDKLPDQWYQE